MREPSIYGLLFRTPVGVMIHIGVYDCLDDAIATAREEIERKLPGNNLFEMDLWVRINGSEALKALLEVEPISSTQTIKEEKPITVQDSASAILKTETIRSVPPPRLSPVNDLMRKLIESNDLTKVNHSRHKLTENERRFVIDEIKNNIKKNK